jgi:outer membrane protein TolC
MNQRRRIEFLRGAVLIAAMLATAVSFAGGQTQAASANAGVDQPVAVTLDEAIRRAEASDPAYAASSAESQSAALDRMIARGGLLPSVVYHNQAIYTQGSGAQANADSPKFIASNGVHEYASQAVVNETLGLGQLAGVRRADAASARAAAELEIARRGLVAAVTGLFNESIAANNKLVVAERAHAEAADFSSLTNKREAAREAARADVVKAQLAEQQRQRDWMDVKVAAEKARLELAVLLFADPHTPFTLVRPAAVAELPSRAEVDLAAAKNNPELKSALASLRVSDGDVQVARATYLPDLGLNVTYGIDAPQFAVNGPSNEHNLGYSASVTLDIPVWDWLTTQHKVKQEEIRRDAVRIALTTTQRRLIVRLDEAYSEASTARDQLASLDASVATATESLRLTKMRYTGGEASVLDVVDAQSAYVSAQNAREDGWVRYEDARADLQTLTGMME